MLARRAVLTLITPPEETIGLASVKQRLHIDHTDDDAELAAIIAACVSFLDGPTGLLGRALVNQTWDERFERFPCGALELALSPVSDVAGVYYMDSAGDQQEIDTAAYDVASNGDTTIITALGGWPAVDLRRPFPIRVRYTAGYGANEASVPAPIRQALMLHIGSLYERRDALMTGGAAITPLGYDDLIAGYRRPSF